MIWQIELIDLLFLQPWNTLTLRQGIKKRQSIRISYLIILLLTSYHLWTFTFLPGINNTIFSYITRGTVNQLLDELVSLLVLS